MKKYVYIVIFTMSVIIFSACGKEDVTINIEELATELINQIEFVDDMTLINDKTVENLYNVTGAVSQKVYISSGATAEELAIFELKDEEDAKKALDAVKERINIQKEDFKTYKPEEILKLDQAIVKRVGKYVIACISNDEEANAIINNGINK